MSTRIKFGVVFFVTSLLTAFVNAGELSGKASLEGRYFIDDGASPAQQTGLAVSASLEAEYKHRTDGDKKQFAFIGFVRQDQKDKKRTHADIRRLEYITLDGDWEYQIGAGKEFWGVAESQHLVDIINQTDVKEGLSSEKLGQPWIRASRILENGSLDFYLLPYFRERKFVGLKGRFRPPLTVDTDATTYESSRKKRHVDYAVRWSNTIDDFDVGLSVFKGTSRDPILSPINPTTLAAHYPLITQYGLDLQYTGEENIWKLEVINRDFKNSTHKDYTAFVAGVEHSVIIEELEGELSLLLEYHHDSRGDIAQAPLQNDVFIGARYAFNDEDSSEILAGVFVDLENSANSLSLEASRRFGNGYKLKVEARTFNKGTLDKDDYIQLVVQKYF